MESAFFWTNKNRAADKVYIDRLNMSPDVWRIARHVTWRPAIVATRHVTTSLTSEVAPRGRERETSMFSRWSSAAINHARWQSSFLSCRQAAPCVDPISVARRRRASIVFAVARRRRASIFLSIGRRPSKATMQLICINKQMINYCCAKRV